MPFYSNYFKQSGFEHEATKISQAFARGDADGAASAISEAMQNELAIIGPAEHCRQEVEARRSLGLQLPVIAPFAVTDDAVTAFRSTIEAFSSKH
jgi:hypothetical protein